LVRIELSIIWEPTLTTSPPEDRRVDRQIDGDVAADAAAQLLLDRVRPDRRRAGGRR
jgi:hypothetical protein